MCLASNMNFAEVDQDSVKNSDGREVMRFNTVSPGQQVSLGPTTTASCFLADHISGAVGRRVESGGMASARKLGLVRLEGRQYVLQDGDISHFLFNV